MYFLVFNLDSVIMYIDISQKECTCFVTLEDRAPMVHCFKQCSVLDFYL